MNRRGFLKNTGLIGLGTQAFPQLLHPDATAAGTIRAAFISDVHIKPTAAAETGFRKVLRHINGQRLGPQFIINGGDAIMDGLAATRASTAEQWESWSRILREENRLPLYHTIGNHDVWGWQLNDASVKDDALYGKAWALKQFGMSERYYSFGKKSWNFIVLDSVQENSGGYIARIDEQQLSWLEKQLQETPSDQFICIVSHIPIVSYCAAMFADENLPNGDWKISRALLHTDARRLTDIFAKYINLRCCLSGHIHLQDAVQYRGVQYFCNGAVSGNWWNGAFKSFKPAYAIFNFEKDGSVTREMIEYAGSE